MKISKSLMALAILGLTACTPTGGSVSAPSASSSANLPGGLAPPPGRTSRERQASKDYYRGARGNEF